MATKATNDHQFKKGDTVIMVGLQSKPDWNNKTATIVGSFDKKKQRWPIQVNFGDKEGALLKPKNMSIAKKDYKPHKESKKDSAFNVVEMQSNRGSNVGPLSNRLHNRRFNQSQWTKYAKRHHLEQYESPFANLLGYDLSVYVNPKSRDPENNAGSVFLTSALSNGRSPHYRGLHGNSVVVCKNKVITSDRLWGMLNFIFEAMDYYDGTCSMNAAQRKAAIARDVKEYKSGSWEPRAGSGGIDLYNDDPKTCRMSRPF